MQIGLSVFECIYSAFVLFLKVTAISYLQAMGRTTCRTGPLLLWRCMRLLLKAVSLYYSCVSSVNLSGKQFKLTKAWASLPATAIAWQLRVFRAWLKRRGCFSPGTVSSCFTCYVWFVLTVLCVHFSIFAILFHFISAMPYHFSPHWFQNNASAERRGG